MRNKIKFFRTSKKRSIRFELVNENKPIILIFFHGFMSNMEGTKPTTLRKFCKTHKIGFLRFEYSGHGKSSGNFIDGNISKWSEDSKELIKAKIKKGKKIIFVGSSMGSWISLKISKFFKSQLCAFVGIASAPEFTEELMWKKFNSNLKKEINTKGIIEIKNDYGSTYPITKQLIFDGRKNKIFNNLKLNLPVSLFHGANDKSVPIKYSLKTLAIFKSSYKKFFKIKKGDHSLSRKMDLRKIQLEIKCLIKNIS